MSDSDNFKFDMSGLENLIDVMNSKKKVQVGIWGGSHPSQKGQTETNADIGYKNEFGFITKFKGKSVPVPARPWLRPAFTEKNVEEMVKRAADFLKKSVKSKDATLFFNGIGIAAMNIIQKAFNDSGYAGKPWAPNRPSTVKLKGSSMPLIDTGSLRRAVVYKVVG